MEAILPHEKDNRRRGIIATICIHALILLVLILPFITFPIPPPGQQGVLVSFGTPDSGQGADRPRVQDQEVVPPSQPSASPATEQEEEAEVRQVSQPVSESREVITSETEEPVVVDEKKDEAPSIDPSEVERQKQLEEEKRLAELEAQRKAEEAKKQREYQESKEQYGNMLSGSGKGDTSTPGNQGQPDGDPDASALQGISTGSGMVGGGLSNRGVLYEPKIQDTSQKTGRVVVSVCVDATGEVVSADYTQRGSTTTDSELKRLAEKSAREFKFNRADIEKQCGTITIDFKVR